ncbi:MAG: 23S rRNA (uracil(1939)-C(5))-methyltransferase RlmD [Clostridia bacterium]|nr:23S rRNA (uracil(1939)-C(5))-methyltransferase RlmD [Clostridia bacterium]
MTKNETREGIVVAVGMNGEGVLKDEGKTVFVPFSLTGEKIKYRVLKVNNNIVFGKVAEILTPADERVRPKCPVFGKCGGCQLQHVKYISQLKIKEDNIATCFKKVAGLKVTVSPTVRGDFEYRYRNKLQLPVATDKNGETIIGFYAENSHRVVPVDDCLINPIWTADVIKAFREYMELAGLKGYDEITGAGDVREITVKEVKGKLLITVVATKDELPQENELLNILEKNVKYVFSLFLNVNKSQGNVIYGDKFRRIRGSKEFSSDMLGIKYSVGVQSFTQVNDCVCAKMYSTVNALIGADEDTTVIDAYSGAGLMTALIAKRAKKTIGIEVVPEAVNIANKVACANKMDDKIVNYLGKCEDILPDVIKGERVNGNKIAVVLDPPRKGCEISVIKALVENQADRIVYVSCKPSTLARDVGLIVGTLAEENGEIKKVENPSPRYTVECVKPFDMFAQTKHVETVVLLTRNSENIENGINR